MSDPRFGVTGGVEPDVCAYSGEKVQGRHSNSFHLSGGLYYRVLGKHLLKWTDTDHARMKIAAPVTPMLPEESPADESAPKSAPKKGDK